MNLAEKYGIDFSRYLRYDETSPSCLRWKVNIRSGEFGSLLNVCEGDVAGTRHQYWRVQLNGKQYRCHSIIWAMFNDNAKILVDHKNGDRYDNRISNLREATKEVNARNRSKHSNNTSGYTGVSFRITNGSEYCTARWRENGKTCSKSYSVAKCGRLKALQLAITARTEAITSLNESGAGYSERHGK